MGKTNSSFSDQIRQTLVSEKDCQYTPHEESRDLRPAAVMIPLVDTEENGLSVLLTTRTKHLHHHPGQVSLPGGMMDETDGNPIETAIRETREEVGISRQYIDVIGGLDHYPTNTGFIVTPIVGQILPGYSLQPDPFEVDDIFMVPLAFIFDEQNHHQHTYIDRQQPGPQRTGYYYQMDYGDKRIWGVTAAILVNFYKRLKDNHPLFCELVPQIRPQ